MKIKINNLKTFFVIAASTVLIGAASNTKADEWFVLSEQALKSTDPSTEIKSKGEQWEKNIKQVKISVEGADVEITKIVLNWDKRPDKTITDVGTIKAGGQTAPSEAPGIKSRLNGVKVQYKILGNATTAKLKVWGYD